MHQTTKIVINNCYGGFGLSDAAIRRYFELKGQKVWLEVIDSLYTEIWLVPPEDRTAELPGDWREHSIEVREEHNRKYSEQTFYVRNMDRTDPILVQVVEELGEDASGSCARLIIKELPKGTLYRINEYDGMESIETAGNVDWSVA
jgi:hypothetical protein